MELPAMMIYFSGSITGRLKKGKGFGFRVDVVPN